MTAVLVTGARGMVGRAVVARLDGLGLPAHAHGGRAAGALEAPGVARDLVAAARPGVVIHCAGLTYGSPDQLWAANALAVVRLLDALEGGAPGARVVLVGSSAEYGLTPPDRYLAEDSPCRPDSEYGLSKLAATRIAALSPVATVVARLFNPVVDDPDPRTLLARVARGYAEGEAAPRGAEEVRDFVPIQQVAAVLAALALAPGRPPPVVNLCTGVPRSAAEQLGRPRPAAPGRWSVGDATLLRATLAGADPLSAR